MSNVQLVIQRLQQHGVPMHQIAGLVGRWQQESGQGLNPKSVGDSGISVGIGQWNKDRRANLENFARQQGKDWRDPIVQTDFAVHEMTKGNERYAGQMLMKARNVDEAAEAAMHYERPQDYTQRNPRGGHGWDNTIKNAYALSGAKPAPGQAPTVGSGLNTFAPTVSGLPAPANPNATPTLPVSPGGWTPLPSGTGAMEPSGFSPSTPTAAPAAPAKEPGLLDKFGGILEGLGPTVKAMMGGGQEQKSEPMAPMNSGYSAEQAARAQAAAAMMQQIMQKRGVKPPGLI